MTRFRQVNNAFFPAQLGQFYVGRLPHLDVVQSVEKNRFFRILLIVNKQSRLTRLLFVSFL